MVERSSNVMFQASAPSPQPSPARGGGGLAPYFSYFLINP